VRELPALGRTKRKVSHVVVASVTALCMVVTLVFVSVTQNRRADAADPVSASGVTVAEGSGDVTFRLDIGADANPAILLQIADETMAANPRLSDTIKESLDGHRLDTPGNTTDQWIDFDGRLAVSGTTVSLTVPGSEVHTEVSWWQAIMATAVGELTKMFVRGLCLAIAPEAAIVCASVGAFISGLVRGIMIQAIDGTLNNPKAWAQTLGLAIVQTVGAAAWEAGIGKWCKTELHRIIERIGVALKDFANTLGGWLAGAAATVVRIADNLIEMARHLPEALQAAAGAWSVPGSGGTVGGGGGASQIAVASYIHPGEDPDAWKRLIASPSDKVSVLVANVLNGPDYQPNPKWASVISAAHASGKKVLGYVRTGYLSRSKDDFTTRLGSRTFADWIAQIQYDVDAWYALYPGNIDGIFFDEGHNECGAGNELADVYLHLNQWTKRKHAGALTVLNPGIGVPQCYEDAADILLTFESDDAGYFGHNALGNNYVPLDTLGWTPKDPSKIWHIIYDVKPDRIPAIMTAARERGAGYVEITDDVMDNPYDNLPNADYWNQEMAAVSGGAPTIAPAALTPTGGGTPAGAPKVTLQRGDYSSATISWDPVAGADRYVVTVDGRPAVELPAKGDMTTVTVGGLQQARAEPYKLAVTAEGAGDAKEASNTVTFTPKALPGGYGIGEAKRSEAGGSVTYTADFYVPYAFQQLFIRSDVPADKCWGITVSPGFGGICAQFMIENGKLMRYSGSGVKGQWKWDKIADVVPKVDGYTYSWTIPADKVKGADTTRFWVQGSGYAPLTYSFSPCPSPAILPDVPGTHCAVAV
jgi:hypothetical protein